MKKTLVAVLLLSSSAVHADGQRILESRCMECHMVDGLGGGKKDAPPMYAVWHHYRQAFHDKTSFVAAVTDWLKEPKKSSAEMKGALKRFGLMDKIEISEADAISVAEYLYDRSFVLPDRYLTHYNDKHGKKEHGYDGTEKAARVPVE